MLPLQVYGAHCFVSPGAHVPPGQVPAATATPLEQLAEQAELQQTIAPPLPVLTQFPLEQSLAPVQDCAFGFLQEPETQVEPASAQSPSLEQLCRQARPLLLQVNGAHWVVPPGVQVPPPQVPAAVAVPFEQPAEHAELQQTLAPAPLLTQWLWAQSTSLVQVCPSLSLQAGLTHW
jgi:hypothetical protein